MSYECCKCKDRGSYSYIYQSDVFSDETIINEYCECNQTMRTKEYFDIIGQIDSACIYNSEEQNAELLENIFKGKCQKTKMKVGKIYGIYCYEN